MIIASNQENLVGCSAMKHYSDDTMEVKRMFVPLMERGKGIATSVLVKLACWATELGYKRCVLETGISQPEAIALYSKLGYIRIPNYGQYKNVATSVCFEKHLN